MFILIVTSGEFAGRYVARSLAGLLGAMGGAAAPEIPVFGTEYSLLLSGTGAGRFTEQTAMEIQQELRHEGLETELVECVRIAPA
jgi:hypothetical protein